MAAAAAEAAAEAERTTTPATVAEPRDAEAAPRSRAARAIPAAPVGEPPITVDAEEPTVRVPLRPVVLAIGFAAVVALALARWPQPAPPPAPQVVVVPVPVEVVDPWEEVLDDAVDAWVDDVTGS